MTHLMAQSQQSALSVSDEIIDRRQVGIEVSLLSEEEKRCIEKLLTENFTPEQDQEKIDIARHAQQIFKLTSEIRSIAAQSLLLHGERIQQAQRIFKDYRFGAFTQWLIQTYGNRQTPYSILKYYEFHLSLNSANRPLLEKIPKRAAYRLAMAQGDQGEKEQILQTYCGESQQAMLQKIESHFPSSKRSSRSKPERRHLVNEQIDLCQLIANYKGTFTHGERRKLVEVGRILQSIGEEEGNL